VTGPAGWRPLALAPLAVASVVAVLPVPAWAHHVGTYVPRDNEVSANFKQIKFSLQAGRFDVALQLFERGALRREMGDRAPTLPPGLEASTIAALQAKDAAEVERHLMLFFAALARDLAAEADRQLAQPGSEEGRCLTAERFLEAIWRYYNLIDFAVSSRASKTSVEVRFAFDDAEGLVKRSPAAGATTPCSEARAATWWSWWRAAPSDLGKLREPFQRIARVLAELIQTSSTSARRDS
jgi:hypothetical protein